MKYDIIDSGSDGNSIIINDFFMLDCGVTYKKIKPYLNKIKLIFISHSHQDHLYTTTIQKIAFEKPTIKFVVGSIDLLEKLIKCGVNKKNIYAIPSNKWFDLGAIKIKLEKVEHDVPNHLCKFKIKDKKGIYIVDCNSVDFVSAKEYDLFLIEANYMKEILEKHKSELDSEGVYDHLYRVENVHLSYEQANDFLINNMGKNSEFEYIHKSKYNFKEEQL